MSNCINRTLGPAGAARNRTQAEALAQGMSRSRSQLAGSLSDPGEENLRPPVADPGEENLRPPVADPGEENLRPPVADPDGLYGSGLHGGHGAHGCGCSGGPAVYVNCCSDDEQDQPSGHLPESCFSGWIIVRLGPGSNPGKKEALHELAEELGLLDLLLIDSPPSNLAAELEPAPGLRAVDNCLPSRLLIRNTTLRLKIEGARPRRRIKVRDKLIELANKTESPRSKAAAGSLLRTWRIDCRQFLARIPRVVKALQALPAVELAYAEALASDPGASGVPVFDADQSYLDAAPVGIGARWAKEMVEDLGNTTKRIHCCDIEQRWVLDHDALKDVKLIQNRAKSTRAPFFGDNRYDKNKAGNLDSEDGNHGTAVSAQLVGNNNVEGIAKDIAHYEIASHYDEPSNSNGNIAEAVVNVLALWYVLGGELKALHGNVILIEAQRCGLVAEIDHADFAAFSLATDLGVVVVEAAGNSGFDLDTYQDQWGRHILRRGGAGFRDSGAVVVGAGWSALPHDRARFSNYGSRVDCYGWGDSGVSAGYGDYDSRGGPDSWYTDSFGGTSCAASIIAGAAALLQYLTRCTTDSALDPLEARATLADRATGTPQGPGVAGNIGVMPDLCALFQQGSLGTPQLYLRRTIADNGWDCREVTCSCPDIMVGPTTGGLASTVGTGENDAPAPGVSPIPAGGGYSVFCRPGNRGLGDAVGNVYLYSSKAATLIHPEMWLPIGADPVEIKAQQGGIPSSLSQVPSPRDGYLAFLAAFGASGDPDSLSKLRCDWSAYRDFLQRADVGCRNTHWIPVTASSPPLPTPCPFQFLFAGAPDRLRTFDFEIVQRLPAGAQVELRVPEPLAIKLRQRQPWKMAWALGPTTQIKLPPTPRLAFRRIRLTAGAKCEASLCVVSDPKTIHRGHSVTIRQLYRGEEVGRLTCYLF